MSTIAISERRKLTLPTTLGLCVSLLVMPVYLLVIGPLFLKPYLSNIAYALTGNAVFWLAALSVLAIVRFGERRPLSSIGLKGLSWKWFAAAVGIGILLMVAVQPLTLVASQLFPSSETGTVASNTAQYPWWLMLFGAVITAGVTEEILYRAYPLERLLAITKKPWLGAVVSFSVFVIVHLQTWNLAHLMGVVVPLGAAMTGLYLWRRNLLFVIIIHSVVNLPLVFLSLISQVQ